MFTIRQAQITDAEALTAIYNEYIRHTTITFETEEITIAENTRRMVDIMAHFPYLVYEEQGHILGYAYVHYWKARAAYRHTAEVTIYLAVNAVGRGIGTCLLSRLIDECRQRDIHVLIACITQGNAASVALHRKLGFVQVSCFHQVGRKFDRWLDVVDMELRL